MADSPASDNDRGRYYGIGGGGGGTTWWETAQAGHMNFIMSTIPGGGWGYDGSSNSYYNSITGEGQSAEGFDVVAVTGGYTLNGQDARNYYAGSTRNLKYLRSSSIIIPELDDGHGNLRTVYDGIVVTKEGATGDWFVEFGSNCYYWNKGANSVNWSEVGSTSVGLALGIGEVVVGIGGEIPSAGISTALIIDGGIRIGSNAIKMRFLLKGHSQRGIATPSNAGGWIGKSIDLATGSSYNDISIGQGVGSFTNDFTTFVVSGGTALSLSKAVMYPSLPTVYSYGLMISGTPYTTVSDAINWHNSNR